MRNKTVYLSSTYVDLIRFRAAVYHTLAMMGYRCKAMEDAVAADERPLDQCLSDVENSDIYIGIFAWRYGFTPRDSVKNPKELSITELEYLRAKDHKKPRYIFLLDEDTLWPPKYVDGVVPSQLGHGCEAGNNIRALRERLKLDRTVSFFTGPEDLCKQLTIALGLTTRVPRPSRFQKMPQPLTAAEFVGRKKELQELEDYLRDDYTAVVSVTGDTGIGKSNFVKVFLDQLSNQSPPYYGSQWKYAWSFYNQDTRSVENSSSEFLTDVLRHYGFDGWYVSEEQRATTLVELLRSEQSILVLDGIDPLLETSTEEREYTGFRDAAMQSFIDRLCREAKEEKLHRGLVIVTSRKPLFSQKERERYDKSYAEISIGFLGRSEGAELLKKLLPSGFTYSDHELQDVSRETGGQPLGLALLGRLLSKEFSGDIRKRADVLTTNPENQYGCAHQVLQWHYRNWITKRESSEVPCAACLSFLRILSLFSRPMSLVELNELISRKVEIAQPLDGDDRLLAESYLQETGLLVRKPEGEWDTHPTVRSFFGDKLQDECKHMWKEAHNALFEYFMGVAKKEPETEDEIEFVSRAIHHGCLADRFSDAYRLYRDRVARDRYGFITESLGLVAWDLTILSRFFPTTKVWTGDAAKDLNETSEAWLRSRAAYCLELLGRLDEAKDQRRRTIKYSESVDDLPGVADGKERLALMEARTEDLETAQRTAEEAVKYAKMAEEASSGKEDEIDSSLERVVHSLSVHGAIYHRLGKYKEAEKCFVEAEGKQREREGKNNLPGNPVYLHSEPGSRYCLFLLDKGCDSSDLKNRIRYMEGWEKEQRVFGRRRPSLLIRAMHHLTNGRIYATETDPLSWESAVREFEAANGLIKQAHNTAYQCQPLLSRADFLRRRGKYDEALADLEEAIQISAHMPLYKAQAFLLRASIELDLAFGYSHRPMEQKRNEKLATDDIHTSEQLVESTKYWLRKPDLKLLRIRLEYYRGESIENCLSDIGKIEMDLGKGNYRFFREECDRVKKEIRGTQFEPSA